mgnify:CR=1 FL=1
MGEGGGVPFKEVAVVSEKGYTLSIYKTRNSCSVGFEGKTAGVGLVQVLGAKTDKVSLVESDYSDCKTEVVIGKEVDKKAVKLK